MCSTVYFRISIMNLVAWDDISSVFSMSSGSESLSFLRSSWLIL